MLECENVNVKLIHLLQSVSLFTLSSEGRKGRTKIVAARNPEPNQIFHRNYIYGKLFTSFFFCFKKLIPFDAIKDAIKNTIKEVIKDN